MKPYGNSRRDNATCRHGCCHGKKVRGGGYSPPPPCRRQGKHRARAEAKDEAQEASNDR